MSTLTFLKNYNNYYNRIVKDNRKEDLSGYTKVTKTNINFNPSNGVNTDLIVNWDQNWTPDYMMVDAVINTNKKRWIDYMTGFYFATRDNDYPVNISGTHEEVMAAMKHFPVWDEDEMQYEYHNYLDTTETIILMDSVYTDWRGEINWNYYQFGIDFTDMPARAFNMKLSDLSQEANPVDIRYANIFISFSNPNTNVSFKSTDVPQEGITFEWLQTLNPAIGDTSTIFNVQFDPNNQDDYTTWQFYPSEVISAEADIATGNTMESSWFVMDMDRIRKGQYKLRLRRDVVADHYDIVSHSPMQIQRAMINSVNNPLLYNSEGMSFNQIKKQELLLKDRSESPWYVLYFKKGIGTKSGAINLGGVDYDYSIPTTIEQSIFGDSSKKYHSTRDMNFKVVFRVHAAGWAWSYPTNRYTMNNKDSGISFDYDGISMETEVIWFTWGFDDCKTRLSSAFRNQYNVIKDKLQTDLGWSLTIPSADLAKINWNNKIVKDSDNKLWKVHVVKNPTTKSGTIATGEAVNYAKTLIQSTGIERNGDYGSRCFEYSVTDDEYVFSYEPYTTTNELSWSIDWTSKAQTIDSEYNIVAIPYNEMGVLITNTLKTIPSTYSKALLDSIYSVYTADELVDVQLLPYCPVQNALATAANKVIDTRYFDSKLIGIDNTNNPTIAWLYVERSNYTLDIAKEIPVSSNPIERKIQNETQMCRLVSPNYQGMFEFSPAKNNGVLTFNIDVTLKPYNPYIHLNPDFKGIYGLDFNDARGLICGGDFSIPKWSTAWSEYELRNKNYRLAFDRQIEHLDFQQQQERTMAAWNIATGSVQGAATGAVAGGMVGGGYGAIAGAVVGGVSSMAGGIADYAMLGDRQLEEKDYMLDSFRFQLGNIKALPNTINKVTPLTYNNKLFPFIEIYEATDEEVKLLQNYLKYRSMNVNTIDYVTNYLQTDEYTFVQATPIRLEDTDLTAVELTEIFEEFKKGVYI